MIFFLPESTILFRQAFDEACKSILDSEIDATFCALLAQFIYCANQNNLLSNTKIEFENLSIARKQEYNAACLEALEEYWNALWAYHKNNPQSRKELLKIKEMMIKPTEISPTPLYFRILFDLNEVQSKFPFYSSIFHAAIFLKQPQSNLTHFSCNEEPVSTKVFKHQLSKRETRWKFLNKIFKNKNSTSLRTIKHKFKYITLVPCASKFKAIKEKFSIPGNSKNEKRQSMRTKAQVDAAFCWERLMFFYQCYTFNNNISAFKHPQKKTPRTTLEYWNSAVARSDQGVLLWAKTILTEKLSSDTPQHGEIFLMPEHQIHRSDLQDYLKAMQRHIHTQLFKIENSVPKTEDNPLLTLPGTQKENFLVDLTSKYWENHPNANHDKVFQNYRLKCPSAHILSRSTWNRIVRLRNLDPRPLSAKTRGKGKKTLQN